MLDDPKDNNRKVWGSKTTVSLFGMLLIIFV